MLSRRSTTRVAAGIAGGLAGAFAMNMAARLLRGDRSGHGAQPPQADGTPGDDDAAARAGAIAYRGLTRREPDRLTRRRLGTAAHYAFGAGAGAAYALIAERMPGVRACFGTLYGTLVWAAADEGLMPLLGLSRGPGEMSLRTHLDSLGQHWVYGAALEAVTRQVNGAGG